jgi:hypothetical protein
MFEPINMPANHDPEAAMRMIETTRGPALVDHSIRQAIEQCWVIMPPHKQNAAAVSSEIRRIVGRALRDLEADSQRPDVR